MQELLGRQRRRMGYGDITMDVMKLVLTAALFVTAPT